MKMRKIYFLMLLLGFFSYDTLARPKSVIQCRKFFDSVKLPNAKNQLRMYKMLEDCSSHFEKDTELLISAINAYKELFRVNRSHFHLGPFMPFYEANTKMIDDIISKIPSEKERENFEERLKTAFREFKEGNG